MKIIKLFKLPKKKLVIILSCFLIVAIIGTYTGIHLYKNSKSKATSNTYVRTTTLRKTTLSDNVSVTGTVQSASVTNVSSTTSGKIESVLVQEGDSVTQGQTICTLDTTDIKKKIEQQEKTLSKSAGEAKSSYDQAVLSYESANSKYTAAKADLAELNAEYNTLKKKYDETVASLKSLQTAYDTAYLADQDMGYKLNSGAATAEQKKSTADALTAAKNALDTAKKNVDFDNMEKEYQTAKSNYEKQSDNLDMLKSNYDKAEDLKVSAKDKLSESSSNDTLIELEEQLENCTIKATSTGIITKVDATVGSMASSGSTLFVIQDPNNLVVSVSIDEADIKKLSTGLKAKITSDATGSKAINGELSQLSKIASSASSSSSSKSVSTQGGSGSSSSTSSTFSAKVKVTDTSPDLLIGMNVSVGIVVTAAENVYIVPYDAVGKDSEGNDIVYVKNDNSYKPVKVTTGLETDYFKVISGDEIKDGVIVRSSADETSISASSTPKSSNSKNTNNQNNGMMNFSRMGGNGGNANGGRGYGGGNGGGGQPPSN